jgi:hypothetical protein
VLAGEQKETTYRFYAPPVAVAVEIEVAVDEGQIVAGR